MNRTSINKNPLSNTASFPKKNLKKINNLFKFLFYSSLIFIKDSSKIDYFFRKKKKIINCLPVSNTESITSRFLNNDSLMYLLLRNYLPLLRYKNIFSIYKLMAYVEIF